MIYKYDFYLVNLLQTVLGIANTIYNWIKLELLSKSEPIMQLQDYLIVARYKLKLNHKET